MGFFRRLFGPRKPYFPPDSGNDPTNNNKKKKNGNKRWGFFNSVENSNDRASTAPCQSDAFNSSSPYVDSLDAHKYAIAVASATAAAAEAALAAAQAAAEAVKLTVPTGGPDATVDEVRIVAAVKIQSAFRGYLARKALRALKALVKLQALVRGHFVRKQTADMLRRMQTLVRVQARACSSRSYSLESLPSVSKSPSSRALVPSSLQKVDRQIRPCSRKFNGPSILRRCGSNSSCRDIINVEKSGIRTNMSGHWMEENLRYNGRAASLRNIQYSQDENMDKILEVDTWKPHLKPHRISNIRPLNAFDSPSRYLRQGPNLISSPSFSSSKFLVVSEDEGSFRSGENSPQVHSASSRLRSSVGRPGPFAPTRSERSLGFVRSCSPNYMANTESFRAKDRSRSVPRQRLEFDN